MILLSRRKDLPAPRADFPPPPRSQSARVARAAFPKEGTIYTRMRVELGVLWREEDFAWLLPTRGEQALAPWRLGLVRVMHFA